MLVVGEGMDFQLAGSSTTTTTTIQDMVLSFVEQSDQSKSKSSKPKLFFKPGDTSPYPLDLSGQLDFLGHQCDPLCMYGA